MRTILLLLLLNCIFLMQGVSQTDQEEKEDQADSVLLQKLKLSKSLRAKDTTIVNRIENQSDIEISELIVNETITKAGNEFHELFYSQWVWPKQLKESFILVIKEKPLRGNSTQVSILINEMMVFQMPLQSRFDYLEAIAEMAVNQATGYLKNYEAIKKSLEGEDIQGSGIF